MEGLTPDCISSACPSQHLKKISPSVRSWLNAVLSRSAFLTPTHFPQMDELHILYNPIVPDPMF